LIDNTDYSREPWCPLTRGAILEYLVCVGVIASAADWTVTGAAGRNGVSLVADASSGRLSYAVKQYGPGDSARETFARELRVLRMIAGLHASQPVHVDDDWLILVLPTVGRSLWELLATGATSALDCAGELRHTLRRLHRLDSEDLSRSPPPVVRWLTGASEPHRASPAQRRYLSAIQAQDWAVQAARACAIAWKDGPRTLVHGDLKLEHVVVGEGRVEIIDWETAGAGLAIWDYAGVAQSVLVRAVVGAGEPTVQEREFVREVTRDLDLRSVDFRRMLALRLIQSGLEWETRRVQSSPKAHAMSRLAADVLRSAKAVSELLE
jgi:hypothetical protein